MSDTEEQLLRGLPVLDLVRVVADSLRADLQAVRILNGRRRPGHAEGGCSQQHEAVMLFHLALLFLLGTPVWTAGRVPMFPPGRVVGAKSYTARSILRHGLMVPGCRGGRHSALLRQGFQVGFGVGLAPPAGRTQAT